MSAICSRYRVSAIFNSSGSLAEPVALVNLPTTTGAACAALYSVKTYGNAGIVPGVTATEITLEGNDRRLNGGLIMKGNVLRKTASPLRRTGNSTDFDGRSRRVFLGASHA